MKRNKQNNVGFSLMELLIVLTLIAILSGISYYAFQSRASHFRLRGSTREVLQMMKLAQTQAIRDNARYRIVFQSPTSYSFEFSASGGNWAAATGAGPLALASNLESGISFSGVAQAGCGGGLGSLPCFSPIFNSDGSLLPSGTLNFIDDKTGEKTGLQWSIGGSIRVQ